MRADPELGRHRDILQAQVHVDEIPRRQLMLPRYFSHAFRRARGGVVYRRDGQRQVPHLVHSVGEFRAASVIRVVPLAQHQARAAVAAVYFLDKKGPSPPLDDFLAICIDGKFCRGIVVDVMLCIHTPPALCEGRERERVVCAPGQERRYNGRLRDGRDGWRRRQPAVRQLWRAENR